MARRVTMDLPRERAAAWQAVIAHDTYLQLRLAVYIIRCGGEALPVGAVNVRSSFANDADRKRLDAAAVHRGTTLGYEPDFSRGVMIGECIVPEGSVGCLFVSDPHVLLNGVRAQVEQRLLGQRLRNRRAAIAAAAGMAVQRLEPVPLVQDASPAG